MKDRTDTLKAGSLRVRHRTVRLCLFLLPVWLLGAGELARFALNSASPGQLERSGAVKGRDFVQFYVAGTLAREGAWHALYDVGALQKAVERIVPAAAGQIPAPVYGPQVALFFSPWTRLPYIAARWWWCAASAFVYFLAAFVVMRAAGSLEGYRVLAWITVVCNPLFAMLLSTGQTGAFAVLAWALATAAFHKNRMLFLGLSLGILAYKPPLLVGPLVVLALLDNRVALTGCVLSVLAQFAVGLVAGTEAWALHARALANLPQHYFLTDTLPHHKQSFSGFFQLLVGSGSASTVLSLVAAALVVFLWWSHRVQRRSVWTMPMLVTTSLLLSPHAYVYDLVVLIPALLVAGPAVVRRSEPGRAHMLVWSGYILFFAPFSGALALHSRLQLSTVTMLVFLLAMHRQFLREGDSPVAPRGLSDVDVERSGSGPFLR